MRLLVLLLPPLIALQTPVNASAQEAPETPQPVHQLLEDDPFPLASKVTVTGERMLNSTYRLSFRYLPGRAVRKSLGEHGFERLTFLISSQPSGLILALVHCGGSEEEAAELSREHGALSHAAVPWSHKLESVSYLPLPKDFDKTVSVELLAFGRRARVLGAESPSLESFSASSLFREMSVLEAGTDADPQ